MLPRDAGISHNHSILQHLSLCCPSPTPLFHLCCNPRTWHQQLSVPAPGSDETSSKCSQGWGC